MNLGIANRIVVTCSEEDPTEESTAHGPYSTAVHCIQSGAYGRAKAALDLAEDAAPTLRSPVSVVQF